MTDTSEQPLDQIEDPAEFVAAARAQLVPVKIEHAPNVAVVEQICEVIPEMAQLSSVGLFPGVELLKGSDEDLAHRRSEIEPYLAKLKQLEQDAENGRKDEKAPVLQITRNIDARWKVLMRHPRAALQRLTNEWQALAGELKRRERERQRLADERARKEREKLAQQAEEAEAKGREARADNLRERAANVQPETGAQLSTSKGEASGAVNYREDWRFEIEDPAQLPREYLTADEQKIGKVVKALKKDANIPGVRVYSVDVPVKKRG